VKKFPTVSVIISIYSDLEALKLIIDALHSQTYPPDEIIISEDAEHSQIKAYTEQLNNSKIIHLTQEDDGWRKARTLNKAVKVSTSEYLIFIDGDCVPYTTFVKSHLQLCEPKTALCGRRTEPGFGFSSHLRSKELTIEAFQKHYIKNIVALLKDKIRHYDEGLYLSPDSFILSIIQKYSRKDSHIVGCHWSCYKNDLVKINGYDEDFHLPTTGEDSDIERRLRHFGIKMKSCRNAAIIVHLFHKKIFNPDISQKMEALMETKKTIFVCKNGLEKY